AIRITINRRVKGFSRETRMAQTSAHASFMLQENRMLIAFDGTTLRTQQTGVGLYSEHLFRHLLERLTDERLYLISNQKIVSSVPLPEDAKIVTAMPFPIRSIWMQCLAP